MESHSPVHAEHAHPTPGLYLRIALILFVLPILLAATIIASLIILFQYWRVVGAKIA